MRRPDPRFQPVNGEAGQRFHNGDFGSVYGDELRLGVEVRLVMALRDS
eukprot:SAG31_NODE_3330_length_4398_cov_5.734589_3_plen_48_part_00